jgi:integrase
VEFFARGLWFQGLRVDEALHLAWDRDDWHRVDLEQERPVIWIRGHYEKGKKDRVHPMAPEFAILLSEVCAVERTGPVFVLPGADRLRPKWQRSWVSGIGAKIGRAAGVVVAKDPVSGREKKRASTIFGGPVHYDGPRT